MNTVKNNGSNDSNTNMSGKMQKSIKFIAIKDFNFKQPSKYVRKNIKIKVREFQVDVDVDVDACDRGSGIL